MHELVILQDNRAITTSLMISEVFGKRHDNVLKDIEDLATQNLGAKNLFHESTYENRGKEYPMYLMNRDGFTLLAMGYTGKKALKFKLQYIDAFNKMEESIKNQIMIPTNPMDALRLMFEVQEGTAKQIESIDNRVVELEENVLLSPGEYNLIGRKVNSRVRVVAKDRQISSERNVLSELFKAINNDVNKVARVRTRAQIKQKDFDIVFDLINVWEPSQATMHVVRELEKGEQS
ncbi:Rha family transcriptional regulator [Erysipelothrix aquatica]|uniref:Rha family transcriptional regulator n=1 Tax=Erysipelothrix aquatica TaxID=2683714 RepID=UPI00135B405C|nr:Rha family transcriptional regulator [Erysipelothrix aquatica]